MTRAELFAEVDFSGACERHPDCEVVVIYNTAIPDFAEGIIGLLLIPREALAKADASGRSISPWRHGDVMRVRAPE